jgi:hypothetical protein
MAARNEAMGWNSTGMSRNLGERMGGNNNDRTIVELRNHFGASGPFGWFDKPGGSEKNGNRCPERENCIIGWAGNPGIRWVREARDDPKKQQHGREDENEISFSECTIMSIEERQMVIRCFEN